MYKLTLFCFIVLSAITVGSVFYPEHFENNGPEILTDNWQMENSDTGIAKFDQGEFYLSSSNANKSIQFIQRIKVKQNFYYLKLSGSLKCNDVIPGQQKWNKARLLLLQYDDSDQRIMAPHEVVSISGTRDWEDYSKYFVMSPSTGELNIIVKLSQSTGAMWVKNLCLVPVIKTQLYLWLKRILFSSWCLFFIFLFYPHASPKKHIYPKIILCCSVIIILFMTAMPGEIKTRIAKKINSQVQVSENIYKQIIPRDISGIGHFFSFILLGASICFLMPMAQIYHILWKILLFAGGNELMQLHVDERTPQLMDFFWDISGAVLGIVLFALFFSKSKTNTSKNTI